MTQDELASGDASHDWAVDHLVAELDAARATGDALIMADAIDTALTVWRAVRQG